MDPQGESYEAYIPGELNTQAPNTFCQPHFTMVLKSYNVGNFYMVALYLN